MRGLAEEKQKGEAQQKWGRKTLKNTACCDSNFTGSLIGVTSVWRVGERVGRGGGTEEVDAEGGKDKRGESGIIGRHARENEQA